MHIKKNWKNVKDLRYKKVNKMKDCRHKNEVLEQEQEAYLK